MKDMEQLDAPTGDSDFVAFVHRETQHLLRVAYLLTRNGQGAQDLVQDALLQAYRQWAKVSAAASAKSYVRKILFNIHLAERRRKRLLTVRLSSDQGHLLVGGAEFQVAERDSLLRAIDVLSPRERSVIILRYYEDLDTPTIAETLSCSQGTVRSLNHRALAKLRVDPNVSLNGPAVRS